MLGPGVHEGMRDRVGAGGVQLHLVERPEVRGVGEKGNQLWAERYGLSAGGVQLLGKQLVEQRGVRGVGAKRG